ncbi:uncharacterized protein LOC144446631 isoform X2 [Glandiceps talaboti]
MASCKKAPKWNSFGCSWYCVFAIVTFLYLMVDAVGRYNHYNGLTWPEGEKPTTALIFYIVLMVAATLTMLAFIPTQLFKTGNPSNDGEKLGRKKHEKKFDMGYDSRKGPSRAQRLLHHFGPLGATLHLVSAFCLLLPILLLQAAEVQHGHLPAAVWSTELDFIFGSSHRSVLSSVQPVPLTSSPLSTISSTESLPVIKTYYFYVSPSISIAFLNYLIPLFLYAVQFADTFWFSHKLFSVVFGVELVLIAINKMFTYCGFSVIYKLGKYGWKDSGIEVEAMLQSSSVVIFLYLASSLVIFLFSLVLYLYGHGQLQRSYKKLQDKEHPADVQNISSIAFQCKGFFAHICAFIVLCILLSLRVPILVDYYRIYEANSDTAMLTFLVFDIIFFLQWITLWILFTVKKDWKFTTQYIYDKPVIPSSQYSTMTVSRKHGGSQQSLSRVVGDGIEMTVVNSGARHTVKNVMKQEAIMRAMKQHPNPPTHNGTLERMHRNPLNKSQDSLQREHGVSDKHPMQSPLPSRHQYNHNSNNHNGTSTLTKSSHSPTDTKGSPFKRNDPTRKILTEKRSLSATSSSDGSGC